MLSFRQLQYFVAIADHQHFRRAAVYLNVSQPTLSVQLQRMEEQLGVRLVERASGSVRLTPVGREILSRARKLLLDLNDLEEFARRGAGDLIGTVSLGVSPTIGPYLLPGIVSVLKRKMPELRLHIREGIPAEQIQELRSGVLDLVLSPITPGGDDLHHERLFAERLYLVAPPDHPLNGLTNLRRSDLRGIQTLSIDPRYPFHQQTREICDELHLELLGDYEGTSLDSLCQMCASGLGLAILPELYLRSEVGGKNVVAPLQIGDWSSTRTVTALWRKNAVFGKNYRKIALVIKREAEHLLDEDVLPLRP